MADVEAALTRTDLPQPVRAAAIELLSLRMPTSAPVTAPDIKAAVMSSGIAGDPATLQPAQTGGNDLKAALQTLKDALTNWIASEEGADPKAAAARPATLPATPLPDPQRATLPPPHRLAQTVPQPPLPASLPDEASAREAAQHLLNKTDGALARQTLLQIASLARGSECLAAGTKRAAAHPRYSAHDAAGHGRGAASHRAGSLKARRPGYPPALARELLHRSRADRAGACLDRAVRRARRGHALCRARRQRQMLREGLPMLEAGLNDAALEAGELRCRAGAPSARVPRPACSWIRRHE